MAAPRNRQPQLPTTVVLIGNLTVAVLGQLQSPCFGNNSLISTRPQTTIARPARIDGFGYWSGQPVSVEFRPAPVDSGIVFARTVGDQTTNIPANLAFRVDTPRRTSIERDGVRVEMVEHLMSALYALKIDNCLIVTSATELPADDGSCHVAAEALTAAGIVEQGCTRSVIEIESTCRVGDDQAWIEASPNPQGGLVIEYRLDYGPGNVIGAQQFAFALNEGDFLQEVAPARTFVLEEGSHTLSATRLWPAYVLPRSVGVRTRRTDRQRIALFQRMRSPQNARPYWRSSVSGR